MTHSAVIYLFAVAPLNSTVATSMRLDTSSLRCELPASHSPFSFPSVVGAIFKSPSHQYIDITRHCSNVQLPVIAS